MVKDKLQFFAHFFAKRSSHAKIAQILPRQVLRYFGTNIVNFVSLPKLSKEADAPANISRVDPTCAAREESGRTPHAKKFKQIFTCLFRRVNTFPKLSQKLVFHEILRENDRIFKFSQKYLDIESKAAAVKSFAVSP